MQSKLSLSYFHERCSQRSFHVYAVLPHSVYVTISSPKCSLPQSHYSKPSLRDSFICQHTSSHSLSQIFSVSYLLTSLMMPFSSPFSQSQHQPSIPQENDSHTNGFEYSNFLVSGTSDPPSTLEIAFPSDIFFPNDDYPPGFPCTSGCGKKFPTVIMQEIHVQHYCKGPYHEIESCQETSVAAPETPSTSSDDDHDGIPRLPPSPGMGQLEPDPALIPAVSTSSGSDHGLTPPLPSSSGTGQLGPDPPSIPSLDVSDLNWTPQLPSSPGISQFDFDFPSILGFDAGFVSDHDVTPPLPSSSGTGQLGPNPTSIPPY